MAEAKVLGEFSSIEEAVEQTGRAYKGKVK